MSNLAYYLKYRPQSLDDLVGQDHIKKNLLGAFSQKRLSHAYLFAGPRGTGKTSTARILAKMVNCESQRVKESKSQSNSDSSPKDDDSLTQVSNIPCNQCTSCLSITDGSNLDLIEIDAASNRGIEDIRSLREKIKLSPTSAKKKVYIIDETHMLTTEAFNALLKTLEEPPSHALFILATTDAQKLPPTILSRVQRLDFKLASQQELMLNLKKIIKEEGIDIEDEARQLLIRKADGSFRDSVKLLDQLSAISKKIKAEDITAVLHGAMFEQVFNMLEHLAGRNSKDSILLIQKQAEDGVDIKVLMVSMMEMMRQLLLIKNDLGQILVQPEIGSDKYDSLQKLAIKFESDFLIKSLKILQEGLERLKFASIPALPLELGVLEICGEKMLDVRSEKIDEEVRSSKLENPTSNLQPQNPISNIQHQTSSDDIAKLKEKWTFVLETIRPFNFSLEALLRSVNISECNDTKIIMEVPYSFHQRILEAPKNRDLLESVLSDILGRSIQIATVLGNRGTKREDIANIELAQDDEIIRVAAEIFNSDSVN